MLPDMSTRFGATAYLPTTKARCRTQRKIRFSRLHGRSARHRGALELHRRNFPLSHRSDITRLRLRDSTFNLRMVAAFYLRCGP
jgi:hypothetical protein